MGLGEDSYSSLIAKAIGFSSRFESFIINKSYFF